VVVSLVWVPTQVGPAGSGALRRRQRPDTPRFEEGQGRAIPVSSRMALGGFFAPAAARSQMSTGIGSPLAARSTPSAHWRSCSAGSASPAAGRYHGPDRRGFVLTLVPAGPHPDSTDPNLGQVIQGVLLVSGRDGRRPGTAAPRARIQRRCRLDERSGDRMAQRPMDRGGRPAAGPAFSGARRRAAPPGARDRVTRPGTSVRPGGQQIRSPRRWDRRRRT